MRALGGTVYVVHALINGDTEIPRMGYHRKVKDTDIYRYYQFGGQPADDGIRRTTSDRVKAQLGLSRIAHSP